MPPEPAVPVSVNLAEVLDAFLPQVAKIEEGFKAIRITLDGLAAPYVRGIVGDPSNVLGISLPTMRELVTQVGLSWQDLWTKTGPGAGG